jgi:hypothetical protein
MPRVPGFYEPFRKAINQLVGLSTNEQNPVTSVVAGAASGAVGGCPFDTVSYTGINHPSLSYSRKPPVLDQSADAGECYYCCYDVPTIP